MTFEQELQRVAEAIREAERCPDYYDEHGGCDGLDGCVECLELAAKAALQASAAR